jgi:hypothetical protein
VVTPQARRKTVKLFRAAAECSERHACGQLEVLRAMFRYRPRERRFAEANDRLRVRLRELAEDRRRWGWRGCTFCCNGDPPRKTLPREVGNFGLRGSVSARLAGTIAVNVTQVMVSSKSLEAGA